LLEAARASVPEAWLKVNRVYGPLVYRWCRKLGVPEHDAADVVQEVFRSLLLNFADFQHGDGRAGFRAWIRSITTNKVRDFFRSTAFRSRAPGGPEHQERIAPDGDLAVDAIESETAEESSAFMHRVLQMIQGEFGETTWRAFWRCTVEGASSTLVADELGISTGAVRQAKYRVLRRLRDELNELA
jgi:RNA polymerase sigma-70 factor (ECF subfamily)